MSQPIRNVSRRDIHVPLGAGQTPVTIRPARPQDAHGISFLYRAAYAARNLEDAREHYPFPQFMDSDCLRQTIAGRKMDWFVAESETEVVGTIGAVRNIGKQDDQVVEYCGLVVSEKWRGNGIAKNLFAALHDKLLKNASFMVAETRTADAGGWRTTRNYEFVPLGFEPFAHRTPAGSEPMLLLGYIPLSAVGQRDAHGQSSRAVQTLAKTVLERLHLEPLAVTERSPYPLFPGPWHELKPELKAVYPTREVSRIDLDKIDEVIRIVDDESAGVRLQRQWRSLDPHLSGVVGLNRLEGEDLTGDRYTTKYFVGYVEASPISCARVVWDRRDRRARILYLQTHFHGLQGLMIFEILEFLKSCSPDTPLSVVIDVRADYPALHATLEQLGFFPTVYYPCLVAGRFGRLDAVQYTWLHNCDFAESWKWIRGLSWAEANRVIDTVKSLATTLRWAFRSTAKV